MKTFIKVTLLTLGLGTVTIPFLAAAETAPEATPTLNEGGRPFHRAMARRRALQKHVARKLDLTAEQISQLKTTRAETKAAIQAIRADSSLAPEQKKAKAREVLQGTRGKMRDLLTAEQQEKFHKMRQRLQSVRRGPV